MYKIDRGSLEEYMQLAERSVESGKADYAALKPCKIYKLTHNGEPLVLIGYRKIEFDEYPGKPFILVSGVFRKDISKHVRVLMEVGPGFLDKIQKYPLIALANEVSPVYSRFLEKFGFVYTETVEKNAEDGTIYKIYVRC